VDHPPAVAFLSPQVNVVVGTPRRVGAEVARQQLVDGHVVEASEALEAGDGDGALTALVGTEHRGLELLLRRGFDCLQREALLLPYSSQTFAHPLCVACRYRLFV